CGLAFVAFCMMSAIARQSLRTCSSLMALRKSSTDASLRFVLSSAIGTSILNFAVRQDSNKGRPAPRRKRLSTLYPHAGQCGSLLLLFLNHSTSIPRRRFRRRPPRRNILPASDRLRSRPGRFGCRLARERPTYVARPAVTLRGSRTIFRNTESLYRHFEPEGSWRRRRRAPRF